MTCTISFSADITDMTQLLDLLIPCCRVYLFPNVMDWCIHIILTLTSGALHPSHQEIYRDTKTQFFPLSQRESAFLSHILCCLSLSLSGTQQAFLTKESKKVFDLHPHLVSACISLSSLTFLPETKMSEGRWMGYLFSSQSSKSSEKHQSPFKLSTILSRSRSRAQKCTTAYGSHIRSRVWGPLHLLVELRAQAENMMVICIVGPCPLLAPARINACCYYYSCCLKVFYGNWALLLSLLFFYSCCSALCVRILLLKQTSMAKGLTS